MRAKRRGLSASSRIPPAQPSVRIATHLWRRCWLLLAVLGFPLTSCQVQARETLVTVNGTAITTDDVQFLALSRRIPEAQLKELQPQLLNVLIERELIRQRLEERRVSAPEARVQTQVGRIHALIRKSGKDPAEVLQSLGFDEDRLKRELSLPLAWEAYLQRVVTQQQIRKFFTDHQPSYDGTQVRVAQIVLRCSASADESEVRAVKSKLQGIRDQLIAKELSFADAVQQYSDAPSKENDGDVGWIRARGQLPKPVTDAALRMKTGELSQPIRSPFGWHLIRVSARKAGEESLEDARPRVWADLSRKIWTELSLQLRKDAQIVWADPPNSTP